MPDLEAQLRAAAGEVPDLDVVPRLVAGAARRRRRRRRTFVVAGLLAVAGAGAAASVLVDDGPPHQVDVVEEGREDGAVFAEDTGVVLLFDDGYDGATALDLDMGNVGRRRIEGQTAGDEGPPFRSGDALVVGYGPPHLAPFDGGPSIPLRDAWVFVPGPDTGDVWAVMGEPEPGGTAAAYTVGRFSAAGELLGQWQTPGGFPMAAVPGGLALERTTAVDLWEAETGSVVATLEDGRALTASSSQLAWCERDCTRLLLRSHATGETVTTDELGGAPYSAVFSPDGSRLAVRFSGGGDVEQLALVDTSDGTVTPVATSPLEPYGPIAWSPDGAQLFFAGRSQGGESLALGRYDVAGDTVEERVLPLTGTLGMLALGPDEAASFLPNAAALGAPDACPPPDVQPSGRPAGVCGFRLAATETDDEPVYRGDGMVLESATDGPVLCSAVFQSRPPQCDGVPLDAWSWDARRRRGVGARHDLGGVLVHGDVGRHGAVDHGDTRPTRRARARPRTDATL
ncbi:MAG: hypothetical protein H0W25_06595 [Acidimicrobiia bacterium]|nr:hypothetical protein [Acidimicrobiia bacterium]